MKVLLVQILLVLFLDVIGNINCSSSSSGAGVAPQSCGTNNEQYCCPSGGKHCAQCSQRSLRCANERCDYQSIGGGNNCFATSGGSFELKLAHVKLFGSSSKRKRQYALEHQFIQYRGFTYEFGKSYGVQILDVNDPDYKYINNQYIKRIDPAGTSQCSWEEATLFTDMWKKPDYRLLTRNCQHFAKALKIFLTESSCSDGSSRNKRQVQGDLEVEIDEILTDCNITCCYDDHPGSHGTINSLSVFSLLLVFFIAGVMY